MNKRKSKNGGRQLRLAEIPDVECHGGEQGVRFCAESRPCWGTPEDMAKLLDAGLADRLMLDWFSNEGRVAYYVLSPGARGLAQDPLISASYELSGMPVPTGLNGENFGGKLAPGLRSTDLEELERMGPLGFMLASLRQATSMALLNSGCVFLTDDNLCELHDRGLKPTEGRKACCKEGTDGEGLPLHYAVADTWDSEEGRAVVARWRELTGCQDEG